MRLFTSEKGQALVELALVTTLFILLVNGITQLVLLGSSQIKLQLATRRAVWLRNRLNNANLQDWQVQKILPGCKIKKITGKNAKQGMSYQVSCQVPAIGFLRLLKPQGFEISTQAGIWVYNPKPITPEELVKTALEKILELTGLYT